MRLSVFALIWFAGAAAVSGFVSHVIPARLDRSLRTAHKGIPPAERSAYQLPPLLPRSSPQHSVVMTQDEPELDLNLKSSQEPQRGRVLLGMANLYSTPKVALLGAAAVATTQLLPHAAVAAETAIPLVSGAVGDSFMEKLTSSGFFQAFSLVFVSEIGDKTFFIAALLAAKTSRLISFAGSVGALAIMTVLAVLLGLAFHSVPSVFTSGLPLDDIIAAAAFLYFGINTLKDAYELPDNSNTGIDEERAEAEESVKELGGKKTVWALILQTFSLVFAAEFGDRSFLTTIALGAAQSPLGVATGAIAAHASATGIAVTGGALLSQYISEKVIGYIGGALFVVFSVTTAIGIF